MLYTLIASKTYYNYYYFYYFYYYYYYLRRSRTPQDNYVIHADSFQNLSIEHLA